MSVGRSLSASVCLGIESSSIDSGAYVVSKNLRVKCTGVV
jgi:hypothetical protein